VSRFPGAEHSANPPGQRRFPVSVRLILMMAVAEAAVTILGPSPQRLSLLRLCDTAAPNAGDAFEDAVAHLIRRGQDGHWGAGALAA
jgi:hypothetical protein